MSVFYNTAQFVWQQASFISFYNVVIVIIHHSQGTAIRLCITWRKRLNYNEIGILNGYTIIYSIKFKLFNLRNVIDCNHQINLEVVRTKRVILLNCKYVYHIVKQPSYIMYFYII